MLSIICFGGSKVKNKCSIKQGYFSIVLEISHRGKFLEPSKSHIEQWDSVIVPVPTQEISWLPSNNAFMWIPARAMECSISHLGGKAVNVSNSTRCSSFEQETCLPFPNNPKQNLDPQAQCALFYGKWAFSVCQQGKFNQSHHQLHHHNISFQGGTYKKFILSVLLLLKIFNFTNLGLRFLYQRGGTL